MCTSASNHLLNTRYVCNNIEIPPCGFSLWTTSVIACKDRYPTTLEVYNFYEFLGRKGGTSAVFILLYCRLIFWWELGLIILHVFLKGGLVVSIIPIMAGVPGPDLPGEYRER